MRTLTWATLLVAVTSVAPAQEPPRHPPQPGPAASSPVRPTEVPVTINGCVKGRRFTLRYQGVYQGVHEEVLRASEFQLEGPRELLQMLRRDHDGHEEEVTGIAIIPPSPTGETVDTRSGRIGGARVTAGVRQTGRQGLPREVTPSDGARPVRIRVQSATHVADTCVSRS